ncbi:uncharacterized protein [Anabrus simplex]|uniref:uncharacterized protein n=1 Tax=Anabrus simplex TaxID=316456 RepID=UPI0035A29BF1
MNDKHIIIVGAGAAGIAAASRLLECGINDLLILEAENRIGGRVWTADFGEGVVDMGGHWVHGEKGNVVFNMANPLNLLGESVTALFDNSTIFVQSSGKFVDMETKSKVLSLMSEIEDESDEDLKTFHGSLGDYFTKEFQRRLKEEHTVSDKDVPLAYSMLDWFEKMENSIDGSDSWFETSGQGLTEYWECDGNLLWTWKTGGYHQALDLLMRKYPDPAQELPVMSKTLLNKEVTKIVWDKSGKEKVRIYCLDGSWYSANHVIVTTSLGVLKEKASVMFSPALPDQKLVAIEGLAIGTVDKIFLKFPYRWWPIDCQGFNLLWSEHDADEFTQENQKARRDKSWLQGVFAFHTVDNQPLALCGWITGPHARHMETLSEDQVTEDAMELLNKFLGKMYNIPQPDEMKRTLWTANPHFRGSYSFRSMKTDRLGTNASRLAEPVLNSEGKPVLLFAGEATHDHYFSTVHGAIETGWREANRLIKLYNCHSLINHSYDVIIIGAGISGLAAARKLLEGGIDNVLILEAQSYTGGRILSLPLNGSWVEAGAQWIHGQNNEIWKLANHYELLTDEVSAEGEGPYIREDGVVLDPALVFEVYNVVAGILEECENYCVSNDSNAPSSIGYYLKKRFDEYLDSCHTDSKEVRDMKQQLYDWHIRFQIIDNSCTFLDKLSAKAWGKYIFSGGKDYVNFKHGYSSLIHSIISSLPSGLVRLNSPVRKIRWKHYVDGPDFNINVKESYTNDVDFGNRSSDTSSEQKHPVIVTCDDGVWFGCEHVIVTSSLGYLKENYRTMFEPALPPLMVQAIQDMGFSTINKIYLLFDKPWWSSDIKGFQLIWSEARTVEPSKNEPSSWTRHLTGFDVLPKHKGVLLGWVGGKGAELVEQLTEDDVGRHCSELLRKFTQQPDIPLPRSVIRTQWYSNPYIRGGYSNTTSMCDSSKVGPVTLSNPVCADVRDGSRTSLQQPVLLFAGEATHESYFSTTHGAYESGQRQASRILEYRKKVKEHLH